MGELTDPAAKAEVLLRWPTYVLGQLWRQGRNEIEKAFAAAGLSLREYLVLEWIDALRNPSQQQIADQMGIDRSDFVTILDHLQERGLIGRERDTADRRRHVLSLTGTGRETLARAVAVSRQVSDAFFGALTPAELATLHRLALKALGEDPALADRRTAGLAQRRERPRTESPDA
jgi:DNA-binding MarR family transcriptional regulator